MTYVIYTVQSGFVFYICYTKEKGAFVSSDAPDNEVLKFSDEDAAQTIADKQSNEKIIYKVKGIKTS